MITLLIIIVVRFSKPSVTNIYNIEHVDTVVIQDVGEKHIDTTINLNYNIN